MSAEEQERQRLLEAAFLLPVPDDKGNRGRGEEEAPRPFTLGSIALCRALGVTLAVGDPSPEDDVEWQALVYDWAHRAPLNDVLRFIQGDWRAIVERAAFHLPEHWSAAPILAEINRQSPMVRAGSVEIRERPKKAGGHEDSEPSDIVEPGFLAGFVFTLLNSTTLSEHEILWELPFARALQYRHCAWRSNMAWTVRGAEAEPVEKILGQAARLAAAVASDELDEDLS